MERGGVGCQDEPILGTRFGTESSWPRIGAQTPISPSAGGIAFPPAEEIVDLLRRPGISRRHLSGRYLAVDQIGARQYAGAIAQVDLALGDFQHVLDIGLREISLDNVPSRCVGDELRHDPAPLFRDDWHGLSAAWAQESVHLCRRFGFPTRASPNDMDQLRKISRQPTRLAPNP